MIAFVLSLLALIGGSSVTFFIMDAPRRQAKKLQSQRMQELSELRAERSENDEWSRRLTRQDQQQREASVELSRREAELKRRAVAYDDLLAENRLIKADLRNMALLVAQREQQSAAVLAQQSSIIQQRESLGQAYLDEVRALTRKSITASNYAANKRRLDEALATLQACGIQPTPAGRKQLMDELEKFFEAAVRAAVEREEQAKIRDRIREEQRAEREAREAIDKAEAERKAIERALNKALGDAANQHAAEIELLRAKLAEAEAKSVRAMSLAQITRTGYVYVISNIGSFGKDVYKIGMTRRLNPQDRVDELGDASVPFPFDVHMIITSDDAPKLEKSLHHAFHKKRVNKANPRKEFFRVTLDEVVVAVRQHHGEVEYTADVEALEFMQSQTMTDEELEEVSEAYEEAGAEGDDEDEEL